MLDRVPLLAVALDVGPDALEVVDHLEPVADRQAQRAQPLVGLGLPLGSKPRRAPMPCTTSRSGREAVTRGSFCRSEPAAALRGLANGALPCSTMPALTSAKAATGK